MALPVVALVITMALAFLYSPAWHGGRLWDDDAHLTSPAMQSLDGLRRIWLEPGAVQQYYPFVHSTFWIVNRFAGEDTLAYHLLNILLHALSACMVAVILRKLAVPWWWLAAAVFAVHPVQVESVAWMTELKNTLSGALYFASAWTYLVFLDRRRRLLYVASLAFFMLALLSKTVTVTLPAALLIVAWWQHGRIDWRRDIRPLIPFFAVGIAAGAMTVWVEHALIGARGVGFEFPIIDRVLVAGRAVWFYLSKILWPWNLTFIYPRWQIDPHQWWQYLFVLGAAAFTVVLWQIRARSRAPLAAWLYFVVTLGPALGFVSVYPFRYSFVADHFQYLACLGIITFVCAALSRVAVRLHTSERLAAVMLTLVLTVPLAVVTWQLSHQYVDATTLYRSTIVRNPDCWMAHNNLGFIQLDTSLEEAIGHFEAAIRLNPDYPEAHNNLGYALQRQGRLDAAVLEHRAAIRLEPTFAEAHANLGTALAGMGRYAEAEAEYRQLVTLRPTRAESYLNVANILALQGRLADAMAEYQEALRRDPGLPAARAGLARIEIERGNSFYAGGQFESAAAAYRESLQLISDSAEAHNNLGAVLERMGRLEEAISHYRETVRLTPDSDAARANLARALGRTKGPGFH